jgi:ABC-type branched-subunit amino acid transport system substrate-binding protein
MQECSQDVVKHHVYHGDGSRLKSLLEPSEETAFARHAQKLISEEGACTIFGCWTSASRKSVLPIIEELDHLLGDYAAWNYFQSLDRPENRVFVEKFRSRYGRRRVTADPMEAGYFGCLSLGAGSGSSWNH